VALGVVVTVCERSCCSLQAAIAGATTWVAIAQWASTAPQALAVYARPPSEPTLRRVLSAIDITVLEAALT
jgi:hypothetical protein